MADKLNWMNEHYILFIHNKVQEVVEKENYKIPFALKELSATEELSYEFTASLEQLGQFKQAIEFMAYNIHHRALAWWGYCCVLSLRDELRHNPAQKRDIADIGKRKPFTTPDWAKNAEKPDISLENFYANPAVKTLLGKIQSLQETCQKVISEAPDWYIDEYNKRLEQTYQVIKEQTGKTPPQMLSEAQQRLADALKFDVKSEVDKSPIVQAKKDLLEKIEQGRTAAVKKVKDALGEPDPKEENLKTKHALDAAYALIQAPNDLNARACLDMGNVCPATVEGLLSLICFWAYGNMTPDPSGITQMVVKTPAGLAANGLNSLILKCTLAKGGFRTPEQRYEHYFKIGKQIGFCENNWSQFITDLTAPHEDYSEKSFKGLFTDEDLKSENHRSVDLDTLFSHLRKESDDEYSELQTVPLQPHTEPLSAESDSKDLQNNVSDDTPQDPEDRKKPSEFIRFKG